MLFAYGIWYSFSLFYLPILEEFGWNRANTVIIFSISSVTYGLGSFVAGALFDRFGPRISFSVAATIMALGLLGCSQASAIWQFCLFFGVLTAFGVAAMGFVPVNALVSNWFIKRRATVVGIAQAGGRETFLLMPLIQLLISNLGWRGTYLTLGIVTPVIVIPLAITLLRYRPQDIGLLPDGAIYSEAEEGTTGDKDSAVIDRAWDSTDWTLRGVMQKYRFWTLCGTLFSIAVTYGVLLTHQVAFIVDIGFTPMFAASLLFIYGVAATVGRASGFLADLMRRETAFTIACGGIVLSILTIVLTQYTLAAWMLYVYIILFGYGSGLSAPAYASAAADIFQGKYFGTILGLANISYGLGASVGSWIAGYIFDIHGNYTLAFTLAILATCSSCTGMWVTSPRKIRLVGRRALLMQKSVVE